MPLDDTRLLVAGRVLVHRTERTVTVPAVVNQQRGLVEYLLVHTSGKRHEALLVTSVEPQHLHLACLLVGAPETGAEPVPLVALTIQWQGHGPLTRRTPEELLLHASHDGEPLAEAFVAPSRWTYQGSRFTGDGFAAQIEGSCIALQADGAALVQAPGLAAGEYIPAAAQLPAVGTPVSLILTFASPAVAPVSKEHS